MEGTAFRNEERSTSAWLRLHKRTKNHAFLETERFAELEEPADVNKEGKRLMSCIRTSELQNIDSDHPPALDGVVIYPDGNPYLFFDLNSSRPSCSIAGVTFVENTNTITETGYNCTDIQESSSSSDIPHEELYIELPDKDEKAKELIQVVDNGYNWTNLYRVYEYIRNEVGNPSQNSWIDKSDENLFTHTANSPEALGHQARHAKPIPAPDDPMSHAEAVALIHTIIREFLEDRHQQEW